MRSIASQMDKFSYLNAVQAHITVVAASLRRIEGQSKGAFIVDIPRICDAIHGLILGAS